MEYLCGDCGCDFEHPETNKEDPICPNCGSENWDENPYF